MNNKWTEEEMKEDDKSHFLIYQVLGVTDEEGELIDVYQNKGRFLYRYAGSFLENAAKLCFQETYPDNERRIYEREYFETRIYCDKQL